MKLYGLFSLFIKYVLEVNKVIMKSSHTLLFLVVLFSFLGLPYNKTHAIQQPHSATLSFMKSETNKDEKLEEAFSKIFQLQPGDVKYYYNRIDLNEDGTPETFVYLSGPLVCGTGGCSALIFQKINEEYKMLSRFSLVRTPIIISETSTNGWKDLIMYVSGGGIEPSYKKLTFAEGTYPLNPSIQQDVEIDEVKGVGIISDNMSEDTGITY